MKTGEEGESENEERDGRRDIQVHPRYDVHMHEYFLCVYTCTHMDEWMGGWMDGWTDGWMDGWIYMTDGGTYICTYTAAR